MRALKIISWGLALWGLTWLWPELNQWLTAPLLLRSILGLSGLLLLDFILQHLAGPHHHQGPHRWRLAQPLGG
jgi:hypothetical protein